MEPRIHTLSGSLRNDACTLTQLQANEYMHSQMIHNLAAPIYTCNTEGYITFYNKAAADLWGREPEHGKEMWCGALKAYGVDGITPIQPGDCPMARALQEGQSVHGVEMIIERPDGKRRNIISYPDPITDAEGNIVGGINLLMDITGLKKKEKELHESKKRYKRMADDLEKRIDERTRALQEVNRALQKSNEELEQFAFIASHDMQEPLRKIRTFSQRLEQSAAKYFDEDNQLYLQKIKKSSDRMSNLINDILNYSKLDYADTQFEDVDLDTIVANVLEDFELKIEQKNASVIVGKLPVVKAMPLQMNQLLHNLISNSLKFARANEPGVINISARRVEGRDVQAHNLQIEPGRQYYEIVVCDNGVGFEQEYAERVFNIFERLYTNEQYTGTGIGLALCKKIAHMHQGDIFAVSHPDIGTEIHVLLPVA